MTNHSHDNNSQSRLEIKNQTIQGGSQQFADTIINNQYGVPQKVVDRLLKELDDKDVKLQEREGVVSNLIQQYKELESFVASRTDDIAKHAKAFLDEGKLEEADKLFEQAQKHDLKNAAANAFSRAKIKVLQLDYPTAKTYYSQAVQLDSDNPLYLNELGFHLYTLGEYAAAEPLYKRSLAILEKTLGENHPNVATRLNNLAVLYYSQGNYAAAESLIKRSLVIREKTLGKDHPSVATSLNNLAELYRTQSNYAAAEHLYIRSLAIREKTLRENHPDVAQSLNNLAALYYAQGNYVAAEPFFIRSLAIGEKILGEKHPNVATSLNNLAMLYEAQGKICEAELLYQRALAIMEKSLGANHPNTKIVKGNLEALQAAKKQ